MFDTYKLTAAVAVLVLATGCASTDVPSDAPEVADKIALTGTRIKTDANVRYFNTAGGKLVVAMDRQDIKRTGAVTIGEALRQGGFTR